ncbi:MAG: ubiquinone/menaquinone biosynthesis methyltransferase [Candidatus Omnitrophica bacterium]|nr:ubiquinone/menaquinone biosynthesis methyltransferase [Candidatus Omnitrophota bacterium]
MDRPPLRRLEARQLGSIPSASVAAREKRPFVQRLFTAIAPRYDWFNRLASCGLDQRWRKEAVVRGGIQPGQRILDVCAGTGDLSFLCANRQRGDGTVVGVDLNREMLRYARRKQRSKRSVISWCQGDAEQLPFADGTFDRVIIGFSTRNLTDLTGGLREMARVLRPEGRLIVLETGYPTSPVVRFGYLVFLSTVARLIGFVLTGRIWPFTYLARSVQRFLTPRQFIERLQSVSAQVDYVPLSYGLANLYVATAISLREIAQ